MLLYILNRFGNMGLLPTSAGMSLNPKFYTQNPKPQTLDMGLLPTSSQIRIAPFGAPRRFQEPSKKHLFF